MIEFDDLEKYSPNDVVQNKVIELVRNKKAHMFIMLFDASKITVEGIQARAYEAFSKYKVHTWFMGKI